MNEPDLSVDLGGLRMKNPVTVASGTFGFGREYAEALAQIAGVRVVFDLPPEAERAGYTKVTRAVLNPAKIERLGWQPRDDLAEGLRETYLCCIP